MTQAENKTLTYHEAIAHMVSWHAKSPFTRHTLSIIQHQAGILTPTAYIQDNSDWLIGALLIHAFFPKPKDSIAFCGSFPSEKAMTIDERYPLGARGIAFSITQALNQQKVTIRISDIQKNERGNLKFSSNIIHNIKQHLLAPESEQIDTWLTAKYHAEKHIIQAGGIHTLTTQSKTKAWRIY